MWDKPLEKCDLEEAGNYEKVKWRLSTTKEKIIPRIAWIDRKKSIDMGLCGNIVYTANCLKCGTKHFAGLNRCRSRFCLECSHQRSMAYLARFLQRFNAEVDHGRQVSLLTMTVRDGPDLQERLDFLRSSWRKIYRIRDYREKFKSRFIGGLRTIEIKIGSGSGLWHPHFHALVVTPPEYEKDYEWFQPVWKNVTNGDGSVDIRKVKSSGKGLIGGILETIKYIVSPEKMTFDVDDQKFYELYLALKGLRAVNTWGTLRGAVEQAEKEAFAIENIEEKMLDFVCQACGWNQAELKAYLAKALEKEKLFDM